MRNQSLAGLPLFKEAYIKELFLDGSIRRRLQDLGFVPNAAVTPLYRSPFGDPTAYQILETVIALRHEDAEKILVSEKQSEVF